MNVITAQVSLYPLRTEHLGPAIDAFAEALREAGLHVESGTMSTLVVGEADAVFDALQRGFEVASEEADVVMQVTVSNACPREDGD
ncbi:MAG: YkoF family thiamine/hydroxymethylpyrimidine-binding protein [Armatimonadota bacterium]